MLRVKLLHPQAKAPTIAHPGEDLGYDVYSCETVTIPARGHAAIPTGIAIELRADDQSAFGNVFGMGVFRGSLGALLRDRSSMAARRLVLTAGVIDAGYRGEIRVLMENLSEQEQTIRAGDKIANLIPYPVLTSSVEVVEDLADSSRKDGGFGSSGR